MTTLRRCFHCAGQKKGQLSLLSFLLLLLLFLFIPSFLPPPPPSRIRPPGYPPGQSGNVADFLPLPPSVTR